jgi:hypothetical protein
VSSDARSKARLGRAARTQTHAATSRFYGNARGEISSASRRRRQRRRIDSRSQGGHGRDARHAEEHVRCSRQGARHVRRKQRRTRTTSTRGELAPGAGAGEGKAAARAQRLHGAGGAEVELGRTTAGSRQGKP